MQGAEKSRLRAQYLTARAARPSAAIERARAAVCAAVLARCDTAGWSCVAGYLPLRTEPGSLELLDALSERGVRVLVPVLLPERDLAWAEWNAAMREGGPALGVDLISSADVVLTPALAVARDGVRLGRGGGSYDRALPRRRAGVPAVALLFGGELVEQLPADPWDQPVTAVVTPAGWQDLTAQ